MPAEPQRPLYLDEVCLFYPELKLVMAHGADPWWGEAIRLLLKYPNLYMMTSAYAPKYLPPELIHFMNTRGAHKVLFHHFYPHYIQDLHGGDAKVLAEKFAPEQSLYFDKDRSDEVFAQVEERARQLGVEVEVPPPFKSQSHHILWGARSKAPSPKDCAYPWTHLFMIWGWKSKREEI